MPERRRTQLAGWQIWLLSLSGGILWVSGVAWLLLHYFGQTEGDFGLEANPFEPWMMRLHGLAMIPLLMGAGSLLVEHIPTGWASGKQRILGSGLGSLLILLTISGYMLYYVGSEDLRGWTSLLHWAIGLALPLIFVWHYVRGKRLGAAQDRLSRDRGRMADADGDTDSA